MYIIFTLILPVPAPQNVGQVSVRRTSSRTFISTNSVFIIMYSTIIDLVPDDEHRGSRLYHVRKWHLPGRGIIPQAHLINQHKICNTNKNRTYVILQYSMTCFAYSISWQLQTIRIWVGTFWLFCLSSSFFSCVMFVCVCVWDPHKFLQNT